MQSKIISETFWIVMTGTIINYPLSLFLLWVLLDVFSMESVFWIGTLTTLGLTVVAFIRVYIIRRHYEISKQ